MKKNLNKQINDYKTRINNYELKIPKINDKSNILDIELIKIKDDFKTIKEEIEKLKSNNECNYILKFIF